MSDTDVAGKVSLPRAKVGLCKTERGHYCEYYSDETRQIIARWYVADKAARL